MYVIFPAEDVVELTLARPPPPRIQHRCSCQCDAFQKRGTVSTQIVSSATSVNRLSTLSQTSSTLPEANNFAAKTIKRKHSKRSKSNKKEKQEKNNSKMGTSLNDPSLKDLSHPSFNDQLIAYNTATFKLVKTVSDFSQEFSRMCEEHATNLQQLVTNYRKKNAELRKERPNCQSTLFYMWETLLQEVEVDSQSQADIANVFARQVSRPLLDRSFYRKVQARKIFGHRDAFEIIIQKAEEKLLKCRQEYRTTYIAHLSSPNSSTTLNNYIDAHNTYVRQLHATNGMVEQYSKETLPALLQELEDVYSDLCLTLSDSVLQGTESISSASSDRIKRYENLISQCRSMMPSTDIAYFIKYLSPLPSQPHPTHRLRMFMYPQLPNSDQDNIPGTSNSDYPSNAEQLALFLPKNELVIDYMPIADVREKYDSLKMETVKLETQIKQLQDSLDTLLRIQQRSLESSVFNKVNELQDDISIKRYDLRIAQIQLAAVRCQKELFSVKLDTVEANSRDRKLSTISNASMKSKWLKAFKSLKTSGPSNGSAKENENRKNEMYHAVSTIIAMRKTGRDGYQITNSPDLVHQFQEYTYKKITPCDLCSQVLRGHTRQGLKCRLCKMNVHLDCQEKVTTRCQTKSRLLRRQKSTSEIETRIIGNMPEEEAPHSPRRHRINWRMKSVSLDSSEPPDFCQPKSTVVGSTASIEPHSSHSSSSRLQSPASPVRNKRLLSTKPVRMSSVELPDENEKSPSSASNSPIPSPIKPQRLLPTNLYVVLYNFKARHSDELDLKAGYKVTVIDMSDHDWWKGKCLGKVGYFPSKYVTKLQSGERILQVTHNLQVSAADNSDKGLTLLRDQIVIQIGEDIDGMIMFRNGDNQQGVCPLEFLQEV